MIINLNVLQEEVMTEVCPHCKKRISDWMNATGKTEFVAGIRVHKACQMDAKPKNNDHEDDGA
jgi:hypothetical protein